MEDSPSPRRTSTPNSVTYAEGAEGRSPRRQRQQEGERIHLFQEREVLPLSPERYLFTERDTTDRALHFVPDFVKGCPAAESKRPSWNRGSRRQEQFFTVIMLQWIQLTNARAHWSSVITNHLSLISHCACSNRRLCMKYDTYQLCKIEGMVLLAALQQRVRGEGGAVELHMESTLNDLWMFHANYSTATSE